MSWYMSVAKEEEKMKNVMCGMINTSLTLVKNVDLHPTHFVKQCYNNKDKYCQLYDLLLRE